MPSKILNVREALRSPLRRRILLTLLENPGLSIRQLARLLGVNVGSLSAHLSILQRLGLVCEVREGGRVSLFVNEQYFPTATYNLALRLLC